MYLIVGANGFLGSYIIKEIMNKCTDRIIATSRNPKSAYINGERISWRHCDVQDDHSVNLLLDEMEKRCEDELKIVYLAAYHHPELVEQNPCYAWDVNVTCLSKFVNKFSFADKFFYSSTDSVYGNSRDGYHFKENDRLNPVNEYGRNKCAAEGIVLNRGGYVARFPFLISPSLTNKKHFYDEIAESIIGGVPFEMYMDSFRSSLSFGNAVSLLIRLMELKSLPYKVINVCGDEDYSKYDVGLMIADQCHVSRDMIIPISMKEANLNFRSKRAGSTLMDNSAIKQILHLDYIPIFDEVAGSYFA